MPEKASILVVDDDSDIRNVLTLMLQREYDVSAVQDGAAALDYMQKNPKTDLVILDVMMPGQSGYEVCDSLRKFSNCPVLFLTARTAESDKISAYRSGGDDFLAKPFSGDELMLKVSVLLRRYRDYRGKPESAVTLENIEVDLAERSVRRFGETMFLTDTEYSILEYLLRHRGVTVSAAELYEAVWKEKFLIGTNNTVMVHLLNLRRKIEDNPSNPTIIRTVWGKGYRID